MRAYAKSVLPWILIGLTPASSLAQQNQARVSAASSKAYRDSGFRGAADFHPLNLDEGVAILGTALDSRHNQSFTSDCSHFVHGLYERAGFPYAYASSTDLYSGIDQFVRVTAPQAGDLIVWRGHVGIVVNTAQHSFFSLLRSGAGVEHYDSPYWKRRGHPRFFRYVKGNLAKPATALRAASLKPTDDEDENAHVGADNDQDPGDRFSKDQAANDSVTNRGEGLAPGLSSSGLSAPGLSSSGVSGAGERRPARIAGAQVASATISRVVIANSSHPSPEQVRSAFMQSCADLEESFRGRDIFRAAQPVVVFDHFVVRRLHLAGTQGWAEVEINELVSVTGGRSETRNHAEIERWPLMRRGHSTWELAPPQSVVYLPQDIAAHLTARRLAQLTKDGQSNGDRNQKTELAQLLNVLLQK